MTDGSLKLQINLILQNLKDERLSGLVVPLMWLDLVSIKVKTCVFLFSSNFCFRIIDSFNTVSDCSKIIIQINICILNWFLDSLNFMD
mgnify:CR=1 FL=1